ncbi:outer membrane autotransporter barrel domain-containing protein [Pseudomonas monteilii]|uniref:Autotransporter outer membrane beta-barrel domain-containing protein n=1 Tax=Pseudomonas monteilii TaxID=76759 RepID=A0AAP7FS75_9PSED|nr:MULTISPECIES: autotransporter outer membrane beta-barrel domain-containing protein [Pseudomonas]AYN16086.1 outer membrane autotransporter barrel domain-containing protein [Pseudomonas monteilii]AYO00253.1 autotransporter outer membrane beta-barrel domain-containing protein [Pseudomonas sp. LTGT-11-2Z]MBA6104966.1 autotransporter outer membrane beta-barrel domain-containing protein [Pseudomonas monteilii]MCE0876380.1 autotransporter outer membrane beta-barrel domain-containing protein [Pseudo
MRCPRLLLPAAFPLLTLPLLAHAESLTVSPGDNLGALVQTNAADTFTIGGGTVLSLQQGNGQDSFTMTGGTLGSLNQGGDMDTFTMTGGTITGAFEDGDIADFQGGSIGRIDLKLADNILNISQNLGIETLVVGNVVSGLGNDTITMTGGTIGGDISTSSGVDKITLSGGTLKGEIRTGNDDDVFTWAGGQIGKRVILENGNDTATVRTLDLGNSAVILDGGTGTDTLSFEQSQVGKGALYANWESINLKQGSQLTLDDTLTLGDLGADQPRVIPPTGTGTLQIDASSSLISRQGSIVSIQSDSKASVVNAGTIDLSSGSDAKGRLTILGDYTGNNGTLRLNSVLAGDGADSDRLVVSRGAISGSTKLSINNLNGAGAATAQNGIQVVEARDGATSTSKAFVQTKTLSVGAYDYRLFKGGVTAGSENSWYLRSNVEAPPAPAPVPAPGEPPVIAPAETPPVAAPAPGQVDLPAPVQGESLPLYRPEVPVYAAAPRGAAIIARQALGTFHQRQGDQQLLKGKSALPASWGQAYGGTVRQQWSGTVSPSLDGDLYGFKVGQDLYAKVGDNGYRQHVGLYVSHSRLEADVKGFALAEENRSVGDLRLDGDSVGTYWTLVGPQGAYLDTVLQYTRLDGRARSDRGDKLNIDGHAWTASLESGYPIALSERWTLEPQAQLIAQKVSLDSASDSVSRISHDAQVELTGRLGVRLEGAFTGSSGRLLQPYAQLNLWHGDGGRDTLTFDDVDKIKTDYRYTSAQLEGGVVAQVSGALSLHGGVQYTANLDSRQQEASGVNLGVRWQF